MGNAYRGWPRWVVAVILAFSSLAFAQDSPPPNVDLPRLRALAEGGDVDRQAGLGAALLFGRGVPKDEAEGLKWLRLAADKGQPLAEYFLGHAYLGGLGMPKDSAQAVAYFKRAAGRGQANAMVSLAQLYHAGEEVERNPAEAAKWAKAAADKGDRDGQRIYGGFLMAGRGVPQDFALAEQWLRKAADQGDPLAKQMIAVIANAKKADESPEALAKSVDFVRRAAGEGQASAQFQLSILYRNGDGVPKDSGIANDWEKKAAQQDHPEALTSRGLRLVTGKDAKPDIPEGVRLLHRAGALGHAPAQRLLGRLYQTGNGVRKDVVESLTWYDLSVRGGDALAQRGQAEVLKVASAAQVAESKRRADAFLARTPRERLPK
jgi:TPR repeat protein